MLGQAAGIAATALPGGHIEGFADSMHSHFREIYRAVGKKQYMHLEAEAAAEVASHAGRGVRVVSLGGGTVENEAAIRVLSDAAALVYVQSSIQKSIVPPHAGDVKSGCGESAAEHAMGQ